jgi:hypothetical protein
MYMGIPSCSPLRHTVPFPSCCLSFCFLVRLFSFRFLFLSPLTAPFPPQVRRDPLSLTNVRGGLSPFFHDTMLFRSQMQGTMPHPPGSFFFSLSFSFADRSPSLTCTWGCPCLVALSRRLRCVALSHRLCFVASVSSPLSRRPRHVTLVVSPSPPLHRPHRVAVASIVSPSPSPHRPGLPASSEWLAPWCDARDNKHPETDVQDLNVSHTAYNFLCLLIIIIRKKAGATEKVIGTGGSGPSGMTDFMKELAIEGLAGRVYR